MTSKIYNLGMGANHIGAIEEEEKSQILRLNSRGRVANCRVG